MSFSQETKSDLAAQVLKKNCCRTSLLYGMLMFSGIFTETRVKLITETEGVANLFSNLLRTVAGIESNIYISEKRSLDDIINSYKLTVAVRSDVMKLTEIFGVERDTVNSDIFKCQTCEISFIRGAFLSGGTVNSPKGRYHLDISTPCKELGEQLCKMLNDNSIQAKCTERQGRTAVYLKDSEQIQDFLTFIGAQQSALDMMQEKIFKDVRNNENRRSNCETANIYRQTGSAEEHTRAINKIKKDGRFSELPRDLQITAELRVENPFSSLEELAAMHEEHISKSGVNHRLKKIVEFSKKQ